MAITLQLVKLALALPDWLAGTLLWKQHGGAELHSAAFTEDGSYLLAVGNKFFKAWSCTTKQPSHPKHCNGSALTLTPRPVTLKEHRNSRFVDVCHAPCLPGQPPGNNGVYALVDSGMLLLMRPTGRLIDKAVSLQVRAAFGLAAAPTQVAAACAQGVVRVFTAKTLTFKATLPRFLARGRHMPADAGAASGGMFPDARGCSFSSDGMLVVVYADQSLIVWNLQDLAKAPLAATSRLCPPVASHVRLTAQFASGTWMLAEMGIKALLQHGNLRLYDTVTLKLLQLLEAHDDEVLCLDYSSLGSDGSFLAASGSRDSLIHIYDAQHGFELLETLDDHSAAVTAVKFVSHGLISVGGDRSIIFRALGSAGGTAAYHVETLPHSLLYDLALDPLQQYVLTTGQDGLLRQWDVASGALVRTLQPEAGAGEPIRLCIDPGGVVAVCCHADGCMRLYHLGSGQLLWRAWGHGDIVCGAVVTPDLTRLVSVGGDGCIIVWKLPEQLTAEITAAVLQSAAANQHNSADCQQQQQQAQNHALQSASSPPPKNAWTTTTTPDPAARTAVDLAVAATSSSDSGIPSALLRIRQGRPLVSSEKLPKWARLPTSPNRSTGSTDVGGSDAAATSAQIGGPNQPGRLDSKWLTSRPSAMNNKWKMSRHSAKAAGVREAATPVAAEAGMILQSLDVDSLPAAPETSTSPPPLSPASATTADAAVADLNWQAADEGTADHPAAGTDLQPLVTASSLECRGQQLLQPKQHQQQIRGQELPHWAAWPHDADMVVIQDWDEASGAVGAVEDSVLQGEWEEVSMQAEASSSLQPESQQQTLPPSLVSEPGPTPGVVRDLFKQHFSSLHAGTAPRPSAPLADDSHGGRHAGTFIEHRQSLSSLFKGRASAAGLGSLTSHMEQGSATTSSADQPESEDDILKTAAKHLHLASATAGAASAHGHDVHDCSSQPAGQAAPHVAGKGEQLQQHQPERRWRHGKMDAELADMRQRLASLQAMYQQHLQQTKPSPRRARESDDAVQQQHQQRQQAMQAGVEGQQEHRNQQEDTTGLAASQQSRALSEKDAAVHQQVDNSCSYFSPAASAISSSSMSQAVSPAQPLQLGRLEPVADHATADPSAAATDGCAVGSRSAEGGSAPGSAALSSRASTPASFLSAEASGDEMSLPGSSGSQVCDGIMTSQPCPPSMPATAMPEDSAAPEALPAGALALPLVAAAAAQLDVLQHNSLLAQLLSCDSPQPLPARHQTGSRARVATAADPAHESEAAADHPVAGQMQANNSSAAVPTAMPVVALNLHLNRHSSECDIRVSIGAAIAARDSSCEASRCMGAVLGAGDDRYWVSQNPCFDMTPLLSSPDTACDSSKAAGLKRPAAATPTPFEVVMAAADNKLWQEETGEVLHTPTATLRPDVASSISSKKSRSQLKSEKAAAKLAAQAAKTTEKAVGSSASGDGAARMGSHGGGMMSLLHRMKKTLPSLRRDSKSLGGDSSQISMTVSSSRASANGQNTQHQPQQGLTRQGPEPEAVGGRPTVAVLAATVDRFRQSVQEMQQLWTQLQDLDLNAQDVTELQHLLTPASGAAGCSSCSRSHGVCGQLTRAGADMSPDAAAACTPSATLSTYRVLHSDSSSGGEWMRQSADFPIVAVKQRLHDELLHSIWDLHATVTGGLPPAISSFGATPEGGSVAVGYLGGLFDPRRSTDSGLSLGRGSVASPACSQHSIALEDIASRVCEQYTELLIKKLDDRKKAKSCPGQPPAPSVKQC
eukprot:gene13699-13821_t